MHLIDISCTIALMMEAASTSETSVDFYQTTRRSDQETACLPLAALRTWNLTWRQYVCPKLFCVLQVQTALRA
jgi:hypothetical protein